MDTNYRDTPSALCHGLCYGLTLLNCPRTFGMRKRYDKMGRNFTLHVSLKDSIANLFTVRYHVTHSAVYTEH